MHALPTPTSSTVVDNGGFSLVEEDDVAFTLALCREINRIYTVYHDGELGVTRGVAEGLGQTLKMLEALEASVVDGMPAMRLQVAAAQAREMSVVLFGAPPLSSMARRPAIQPAPVLPVANAEPARPRRPWRDRWAALWSGRSPAVG